MTKFESLKSDLIHALVEYERVKLNSGDYTPEYLAECEFCLCECLDKLKREVLG